MSYLKITVVKAGLLAAIVITASVVGTILYESNQNIWPQADEIDVYEWSEDQSKSEIPYYVSVGLEDESHYFGSGILTHNLSRFEAFYNATSNDEWAISATFTNVFNDSGYTDQQVNKFTLLELINLPSLKQSIKSLIPYNEKIIDDPVQDSKGKDVINLFIEEKSGKDRSETTSINLDIITLDGISIKVRIFDFGIILSSSWVYYKTINVSNVRTDAELFDQFALNYMYQDSMNNVQTDEQIIGMETADISLNYYYYIEKSSLIEGLKLDYIQFWNNTISELKA